jgi:hypothetical protein
MRGSHFVEIDFVESSFKLQIQFLVLLLIFHGAFIELFLDSRLAHGFVSCIVKLGDQKVVKLVGRVLGHDAIDGGDLLLESNHLVHHVGADRFILDFANSILTLVHLLVDLFDLLVDLLADILWHLLQLLDVIKDSLFG